MSKPHLSERERSFLHDAAQYLERPSFVMKVAEVVGKPVEAIAGRIIPAQVNEIANKALQHAMGYAADSVFHSRGLDAEFEKSLRSSGWDGFWHKVASTVPALVSGPFGIAGLAVELPITTGIMFRSIASTAATFGEKLDDPAVRLECLTVFSHGGPSPDDDAMESSYLTTRFALTALIQDAARFLTAHTAKEVSEAVLRGTAPRLVTLLGVVASRFNFVVTEKFLAQSLPIISMGTGALVNAAFTDHFNRVAQFHFGIKKLERHFGTEIVQDVYKTEVRNLAPAPRGFFTK